MTLLSKIKYFFYNDRFNQLSWWRKCWIRFWEFIENTLWQKGLYPHLKPRTWYEDRRDFWKNLTVPNTVTGFYWKSPEGGFNGELQEEGGDWSLCCFHGETTEEVKGRMIDVYDHFVEEAGLRFPYKPYSITWKEQETHEEVM